MLRKYSVGRPRLSDDAIKEITDLYEKGYSTASIAEHLGRSRSTVWKYCNEWKNNNETS
ncbi:helix-turn-helix domain-containing protein [Vibrio parahaemolyticus]